VNIELREHGSHYELPRLQSEVGAALKPLVGVSEAVGRQTRLKPGGKVGVVRAGDVTVYVQPKLPISHLLFLVDFAIKPTAWRDPLVSVAEGGELVATVADVYAALAQRSLSRGLLQGYRSVDAALPVLRGRLRLSEQFGGRSGAPLPLEVRYNELTVDIPENQILRAAAVAALRLPRLRDQACSRLARIVATLTGVTALTVGEPLPAWHRTRLNIAHQDALSMAELVLRGSGFQPTPGAVPTFGFVLDMHVVYEQFLCAAMGSALKERLGGVPQTQAIDPLDNHCLAMIRPDLVHQVGGRPVAVMDAKYKFGQKNVRDDLYQMVVYCTALGLVHGHLIYAEGPPGRIVHEIQNSPIKVVRHALDLARSPDDLLADIALIADSIADGVA
jgi:5-methylcytosine-specific restriction enzyme subunit McrC